MQELKIGFIGGGNMAGALIGGLAGKMTAGKNIHVIDPSAEKIQELHTRFGVTGAIQPDKALEQCDVLILAIKPQQTREALLALAPFIRKQLVLSVIAGIRAEKLSHWLGAYQAIVRTIPNTPAMVHQGMTGMYATKAVDAAQRALAEKIMQAVGMSVWVDEEDLLDAVTAVSGSGPAYVFYFMEALQQAGEALGLSASQANQLALYTFKGASELALQSSDPLDILREKVTSPNGTTFAALNSMQQAAVDKAIIKGAQAAAVRSVELGQEFGKEG